MKKLVLLFLALLLFFCSCENDKKSDCKYFDLPEEIENRERIEAALSFLYDSMLLENGGIRTNYLDSSKYEMANGSEILSESMGLYMTIASNIGAVEEGLCIFDFVKEKMCYEDGLFYWKISDDKINVNATIDDLRIAKALYYLDSENENLSIIGKAIYEKCTRDGYLVNYYNENIKKNDNKINLSYLDIEALYLLSRSYNLIEDIISKNYSIIENGYIADEFPLYYVAYDFENGDYIREGEINTIEPLIVLLHLCEIDRVNDKSIKWLKNAIFNNSLYPSYDVSSYEPINMFESTALYAISAQIALELEDKELYNNCISKMLKLQVMDEDSKIYGAFGYAPTLEVYSFDHLNALLALTKKWRTKDK